MRHSLLRVVYGISSELKMKLALFLERRIVICSQAGIRLTVGAAIWPAARQGRQAVAMLLLRAAWQRRSAAAD
jgi:hypothetical protein